jgi:muconolactone delta-isomerase
MNTYLILATFKPGTDMNEVMAVREAEEAQVLVLRNEGRIGKILLSLPKNTVFIEVFADSEESAEATTRTLPISKWWDITVYPTAKIPMDM